MYKDMVAGDHIALLIHAQAAVSITIVGKANVQTLFHHELLQALDMGGAGIVVDVQAVGLCIDDIGICAQRIEHRLGDVPGAAVGTVQTNLDTLEGIDAEADQVAHVAVTTRNIVHSAANVLTVSKRQFRPVLIEHVQFAVNVILDLQQDLLRHLLAIAVDQLDAVIVVGIMAGRNHDAAIKIIHPGDVGHRRGCGDMEQIGICTRSGQACNQTILEHIRAPASILTDNDTSRLVVAVALPVHIVVPAKEAAHLIGMVSSQSDSGFPTETIGSKIFSHYNIFPHSKSS